MPCKRPAGKNWPSLFQPFKSKNLQPMSIETNHLKTLISKLNDTSRGALEKAANFCIAQSHYEVDVEHLFLKLLEAPHSDFAILCGRFDVSTTQLQRDLEAEIKRFKRGNARSPVFSKQLPVLLENAWLVASLESHTAHIRSSHLLLALLTEPGLKQLAQASSKLFGQFGVEALKHKLAELTVGSEEAAEPRHADASSTQDDEAGADAITQPSKTPALDQYTTNLTQRARSGKIDPVIGRDPEIRQCIDILMRRRQNNPILTGEAGVGKTAVAEGLALRIATGDVPKPLQGVALHTLDMGLLQAGASVKGEFENRLKNVIDEVKKSIHPIILFIDEVHTMIGAGGQAGQNDAANLLKPALARGELRTIAATTWSEYKKYFEKDAALARRFQVVKVDEPSEPMAQAMLRGMAALMEKHFNVQVLDQAIIEAVRLSARYITERQLPDKAISVLDTACAKVALGQTTVPAVIEDKQRNMERNSARLAMLVREQAVGENHTASIAQLREEQQQLTEELAKLNTRWEAEKTLVAQIQVLRTEAQTAPLEPTQEPTPDSKPKIKAKAKPARSKALQVKLDELAQLQGEDPMVPMQVDANVVAQIVAAWTGIPMGKMVKNDIQAVLDLFPTLRQRVIGQDHALQVVAQRVRTAKANLEDPGKPKGVFLFVGPSGVGKSETALALADLFYGGERNIITINLSEYKEAHSVSSLKGSPPGYVGYGEGGVLTEAVRRRPYSVLLLDEAEKAHPAVLEMFFEVFDKGVMDDAEGRQIDFRNTFIILTSNTASKEIMQACLNKAPQDLPGVDALTTQINEQLYKTFKPAFLGRMKVVPYYPISDDVLEQIIRLKLDRITERVLANQQAKLEYDDAFVEAVLARCTETDSGARAIDHILNGTLLPEIAEHVLANMAVGKAVGRIKVSAGKEGKFKYAVSLAKAGA
jgi:type VI secretion system protein VasG